MKKALAIVGLGLLLAAADMPPFVYFRSYQSADILRYRLNVTQELNGAFDTEETTDTRHFVFGGQITGEEVTFESLIFRDKKEGRKDLSSLAQKVPPIRFSLAKDWRNRIPEIDIVAMRGVVTDMYTFFSAIGDGSGIRRLHAAGDVTESQDLHRNVWSSDRFVPLGENCATMRLKLDSVDRDTARVTSEFLPPAEPCLQMQRAWMAEDVVPGTPNNYQSVRYDGDGYTLIWGREEITVKTEIEAQTGVIRKAVLDDTLNLKMRRGCNQEYDNCQPESTFVIHRKGTLQRR